MSVPRDATKRATDFRTSHKIPLVGGQILNNNALEAYAANGANLAKMTQSDEDLARLETEAWNRDTSEINPLDTLSLCRAFHREEARVLPAIENALQTIASFIDALVPRLRSGGRLVYVGAGNSGRIALMDCTELPVTFSVGRLQFLCVVPAGSVSSGAPAPEGAEDVGEDGAAALEALNLSDQDTVVGISASGRTPFVLNALKVAVARGAMTAAVTNVQSALISRLPLDYTISTLVGAEFITGSTRLKAGTAAKVILNMISTCTMIRLGKTYRGLMVDVCVQNEKLRHRARRIVQQVCRSVETDALTARHRQPPGISVPIPIPIPETHDGDILLDSLIEGCGGSVKLACAVALLGLAPDAAQMRLDSVGGDLSRLVQTLSPPGPELEIPIPVVPRSSERVFLAIDGGGTKCTACLAIWQGSEIITAQGTSGPCNVHCTSLAEILERVQAATMQAAAALRRKLPMLSASLEITRAWVGIAGVDNATQSTIDTLARSLEEIFHMARGSGGLRLTSDGMLLGACIEANTHVETALAVVAGTGSVALAFGRDTSTGETVCRRKAGGWGYLLGDEGSAFDIGKHALRTAMTQIETNSDENPDMSDLQRELLAACGCTHLDRLLPSILQAPGTVSKRIIADLAVAVTRLAFRTKNPDPEALTILRSAIEDLLQAIKRLLPVVRTQKGGSAMLILSGSLMNLAPYRRLFLEVWELQGLNHFSEVEVVKDPATAAAEKLARSCFVGS
jgi:N-acetylmuramic acid 6-phosphate etherase